MDVTVGTLLGGFLGSSSPPCHSFQPLTKAQEESRPPLWGGRNLSAFKVLQEWDHARNQPLVPHFINFALEEIDVFLGEMRKSPLLE